MCSWAAASAVAGGGVAARLRLAAVTVGRANTVRGAFYRRLGARIGKFKVITATARRIAVLFYNTMRFGMRYVNPGADHCRTAVPRARDQATASSRSCVWLNVAGG